MTKAQIQAILDEHNEIFPALRESSAAFDAAMEGMRATLTALLNANQQQGLAITAAIEANQAALRLLQDEA